MCESDPGTLQCQLAVQEQIGEQILASMCKASFTFSWTGLAALSSTLVPSPLLHASLCSLTRVSRCLCIYPMYTLPHWKGIWQTTPASFWCLYCYSIVNNSTEARFVCMLYSFTPNVHVVIHQVCTVDQHILSMHITCISYWTHPIVNGPYTPTITCTYMCNCQDNTKLACHCTAHCKMEWIYTRTKIRGQDRLELDMEIQKEKKIEKWPFFEHLVLACDSNFICCFSCVFPQSNNQRNLIAKGTANYAWKSNTFPPKAEVGI